MTPRTAMLAQWALCAAQSALLAASPPNPPPGQTGGAVTHSKRAQSTTVPAAGNDFLTDPTDQQRSLPQINRRIALEAASLIKAHRLNEAADVLDESEIQIREFAAASHMELWDSTIAPIMRLLDLRRSTIQRERTAATQPATQPHTTRLSPEQNRTLAQIRTELGTTGSQIRQNQLAGAEKTLKAAQRTLRQLVRTSGLPVWSVPVATLFQLADARQNELNEKKSAAQEAEQQTKVKATVTSKESADESPGSGLPVGAPAPPFTAVTLDGRPFTTQQLKGKWVLLDFWATWCGPCKAEMPHIREAFDAFGKDKRLVIMSLSNDAQIATPANYAAQNQMNWVQAFIGESSPVSKLYNIHWIPTILLIDPDGKIAANNLRGNAIKKKLAEVLSQPIGADQTK